MLRQESTISVIISNYSIASGKAVLYEVQQEAIGMLQVS
jgi:hypothetical protein